MKIFFKKLSLVFDVIMHFLTFFMFKNTIFSVKKWQKLHSKHKFKSTKSAFFGLKKQQLFTEITFFSLLWRQLQFCAMSHLTVSKCQHHHQLWLKNSKNEFSSFLQITRTHRQIFSVFSFWKNKKATQDCKYILPYIKWMHL